MSRLQAVQAEATGFGSLEATRKAECQVKGMDGKMEILEPKMMTNHRSGPESGVFFAGWVVLKYEGSSFGR